MQTLQVRPVTINHLVRAPMTPQVMNLAVVRITMHTKSKKFWTIG